MQIVIINGSPRAKGSTGKALGVIKDKLLSLDQTIELYEYHLGEIKPRYCDGCLSCYRTGHCHNKEDGIEEISKRIDSSDGVIFGSPTYGSNVSGQLKVFIDRAHLLIEQLLKNKPCITIATYENADGSKALSILNKLVKVSGGYITCSLKIKIEYNKNLIDTKIIHKLITGANRLYKNVQHPHKLWGGFLNFAAFHFVLKPYALRNKFRYKGVIDRWKEKKLIS